MFPPLHLPPSLARSRFPVSVLICTLIGRLRYSSPVVPVLTGGTRSPPVVPVLPVVAVLTAGEYGTTGGEDGDGE